MSSNLKIRVSRGEFGWNVHVIVSLVNGTNAIQMMSAAPTREKAIELGEHMIKHHNSSVLKR